MKFLLLRNEESVSDIADKAYKGLTTEGRLRAEKELLKANPELKTFRSVRKGFVVRIPELRDEGESNTRNVVSPTEHLGSEISENLKLIETTLNKKYSSFEAWGKSTNEQLKLVDKELKTYPNGELAAKTLRKHITDSKKLHSTNKQLSTEALKKLQKTVAGL